MAILMLQKVSFTWEDLVRRPRQTRRNKPVPEDMLKAAKAAYLRGMEILELKSSYVIYDVDKVDTDRGSLYISSPGHKAGELHIGERTGYLVPASSVVASVCTAGKAIADAIAESSLNKEYLMMYYLDSFAVRALSEMSALLRGKIEELARKDGLGVGPFMQPGSVRGWPVSGQRDLFKLAEAQSLGLTVNDADILVPNISNSELIGIGKDYSSSKIGSMCHECPRHNDCLWRRENAAQEG